MPAKYFLKLGDFGEFEVMTVRSLEFLLGAPRERPGLTYPRAEGLEVLISGDYRHLSPRLFSELFLAEASGQHLGEATLTVKEVIGYRWSRHHLSRLSYHFTDVYVADFRLVGDTPPDALVTFGFKTMTLRVFD